MPYAGPRAPGAEPDVVLRGRDGDEAGADSLTLARRETSHGDKPQKRRGTHVVCTPLVVLRGRRPPEPWLSATRHGDAACHFVRRTIVVPFGLAQAIHPDRSGQISAPLQRGFVAWV